jgi:rubrerythrin
MPENSAATEKSAEMLSLYVQICEAATAWHIAEQELMHTSMYLARFAGKTSQQRLEIASVLYRLEDDIKIPCVDKIDMPAIESEPLRNALAIDGIACSGLQAQEKPAGLTSLLISALEETLLQAEEAVELMDHADYYVCSGCGVRLETAVECPICGAPASCVEPRKNLPDEG